MYVVNECFNVMMGDQLVCSFVRRPALLHCARFWTQQIQLYLVSYGLGQVVQSVCTLCNLWQGKTFLWRLLLSSLELQHLLCNNKDKPVQ
jgi:hypothetical protein